MFEASTLIPKLLDPILAKLGTGAANLGVAAGKGVLDAFRMNFSDYLHSATRRAEQIKTLLHRDDPISLFSIYVTTYLESGSRQIRDAAVIDRARRSHSFFVLGSAGSGKSIFMKYLFLQLVEGNAGKIPLMLELRNLNSPNYNGDFLSFLHGSVVRPGSIITTEQLNACLRENLLILILDGLDEIEHNRRTSVEEQILQLPRIRELIAEIQRVDPVLDVIRYSKIVYGDLGFTMWDDDNYNIVILKQSKWASFVFALRRLYDERFTALTEWGDDAAGKERDRELLTRELGKRRMKGAASGIQGRIKDGDILRIKDTDWFKDTRFGQHFSKLHQDLTTLGGAVETSVAEQRDLTGELFT